MAKKLGNSNASALWGASNRRTLLPILRRSRRTSEGRKPQRTSEGAQATEEPMEILWLRLRTTEKGFRTAKGRSFAAFTTTRSYKNF